MLTEAQVARLVGRLQKLLQTAEEVEISHENASKYHTKNSALYRSESKAASYWNGRKNATNMALNSISTLLEENKQAETVA